MAQTRTKHADPSAKRKKRLKAPVRKAANIKTKQDLIELKKKIEKLLAAKGIKTPRQSKPVVTPVAKRSLSNDLDRARLARISALAEKVFGDQDKARRWLGQPKRALGGKAPLSYMTDDSGEQIITQMLYQIDYGLFS